MLLERRTFSPVATDPVKLSLWRRNLDARSAVRYLTASTFTTLITPSGKPASLASSGDSRRVSGVYSQF